MGKEGLQGLPEIPLPVNTWVSLGEYRDAIHEFPDGEEVSTLIALLRSEQIGRIELDFFWYQPWIRNYERLKTNKPALLFDPLRGLQRLTCQEVFAAQRTMETPLYDISGMALDPSLVDQDLPYNFQFRFPEGEILVCPFLKRPALKPIFDARHQEYYLANSNYTGIFSVFLPKVGIQQLDVIVTPQVTE